MRIHQLEQRLANQIAAGEVVERPASIVKELLENSIDAGATYLKIEIEKGGMSRIVISDNGCGIVKEDLPLALARHATSKISTSEDLQNIQSLGFRGEALASICSVSHLVLQSAVADADTAWQVIAEGKTLSPRISPVAHPVGTTIEVRDLFFNLPARRKFLRSAKTEFIRIEDIVKKIALSQESLKVELKNNGRSVLSIPSIQEAGTQEKRIQAICGQRFIEHVSHVEFKATDLALTGYISMPDYSRSQTDLQYFFLNGRVIRDKVISHAIRQAYADVISPGRYPCFILYLTINPASVDVNVHPTKHEVRFRESQLVHDFILYRLASVLHDQPLPPIPSFPQQSERQVAEPAMTYTLSAPVSKIRVEQTIANRFVLYTYTTNLYCFDLVRAIKQQLDTLLTSNPGSFAAAKELLFPERLVYPSGSVNHSIIQQLASLGVNLAEDDQHIIIYTLPAVLHWVDITALSEILINIICTSKTMTQATILEALGELLPQHLQSLNTGELLEFITTLVEQPSKNSKAIYCQLTVARLDALLELTI